MLNYKKEKSIFYKNIIVNYIFSFNYSILPLKMYSTNCIGFSVNSFMYFSNICFFKMSSIFFLSNITDNLSFQSFSFNNSNSGGNSSIMLSIIYLYRKNLFLNFFITTFSIIGNKNCYINSSETLFMSNI